MGYYTGSGHVVSGGSVTSLRSTGPAVGGAYYCYQRTNTTTTEMNGVSLDTAKNYNSDIYMTYFQWPLGAVEPACRGWRNNYSYSQINGSNLYTLVKTNEVIQFRGVQGKYDSGWCS